MEDQNVTAAQVIAASEKLETDSAALYRELAARFPQRAGMFEAAAQDSEKLRLTITRTYQETISDALEACFCFQGLRLKDYGADMGLGGKVALAEALQVAKALEKTAVTFYEEVAVRSQSLLATIPGAFKRAARKRTARLQEIEALHQRSR